MVNSVSSVFDPTLPLKGEVKVVDSFSSEVDPTLPSKSEFQVVNIDSSVIDPIIPLKSEVKVVDLLVLIGLTWVYFNVPTIPLSHWPF